MMVWKDGNQVKQLVQKAAKCIARIIESRIGIITGSGFDFYIYYVIKKR